MKRKLLLGLLLPIAIASLSACATDFPTHYSAEAIEAKVIDADTKQPLEGVIVTANWQLESGNAGGSFVVGQMMVMEAVTDKEGIFRFSAWGPIKLRQGLLLDKDPQLLFFKTGYEYRRLSNYGRRPLEGLWRDAVRTSQWNGKTIELKSLRNADATARYKNLLNFSSEVGHFSKWHLDPCQWTNLPLSIQEIMRERKKLGAQGVKSEWDRTLDMALLDNEQHFLKQCGSAAQKFFDEILR